MSSIHRLSYHPGCFILNLELNVIATFITGCVTSISGFVLYLINVNVLNHYHAGMIKLVFRYFSSNRHIATHLSAGERPLHLAAQFARQFAPFDPGGHLDVQFEALTESEAPL